MTSKNVIGSSLRNWSAVKVLIVRTQGCTGTLSRNLVAIASVFVDHLEANARVSRTSDRA